MSAFWEDGVLLSKGHTPVQAWPKDFIDTEGEEERRKGEGGSAIPRQLKKKRGRFLEASWFQG